MILRSFSYSALIMLYGAGLMWLGFARRSALLRWQAIAADRGDDRQGVFLRCLGAGSRLAGAELHCSGSAAAGDLLCLSARLAGAAAAAHGVKRSGRQSSPGPHHQPSATSAHQNKAIQVTTKTPMSAMGDAGRNIAVRSRAPHRVSPNTSSRMPYFVPQESGASTHAPAEFCGTMRTPRTPEWRRRSTH